MITLQISQGFGQIGLEIKDAQYVLAQKRPDLHLERTAPDLNVAAEKPVLDIDYTQRLASMELGGIIFMARNLTSKLKAEFATNLEKTVQTGKRIGEIENNVSIGQAVFDAAAPKEREVVLAPLAPIEISYSPAQLKFSVQMGDIKYTADLGKVSVEDFTCPSVKVFMEKQPYLEIQAVGQAIDLQK